jgi:hypothetical protein
VIRTFRDGKTRRLYEDNRRRGFRGLDYDRALNGFKGRVAKPFNLVDLSVVLASVLEDTLL